MQKTAGRLFGQAFLSLILLFALAHLVVIKNNILMFALPVLVVLLLLSTIGLATYKKGGDRLLFTAFLLHTLNVLVLWFLYDSFYIVLLLVSLLGLLISRPNCSRKVKVCDDCTCESMAPTVSTPPPQKVVDGKVVEAAVEAKERAEPKEHAGKTPSNTSTQSVKATFTPGKYVASKRSNVYHEPRCDWAKKIKKDRRVWFVSREEALNKGYKKHDCVK